MQNKKSVTKAVYQYHEKELKSQAATQITCRYINLDACSFTKPHPVWQTALSYWCEVTRACLKVKILTGIYYLQTKWSIFKNEQCKPICILCNEQVENRMHFILRCSATTDIRDQYLPTIYNSVEAALGPDHTKNLWSNAESRLQLVLDSSCYLRKTDNITAIEIISRQFLYALYLRHTTTIVALDLKPHTLPIPCPDSEPPPAADTTHATEQLPPQQRWDAS